MDKTESVGIIKYIGPDVKDGTIDTEKLGKALLGLNDAFKKILSQNVEYKKIDPVLKVFLQKGSVEIAAYVAAGVVVAQQVGLFEIGKQFFGEIGRQLALKKFAKNGSLTKEGRPEIDGGKMFVIVVNIDGEKKKIDAVSYNLFNKKIIDKSLLAIIEPLEKDKIDKVQCINNYNDKSELEIVEIMESDKVYYEDVEDLEFESKNEEDFDENVAEKIEGLKGRLVSYQALASKYPFNFQPREEQKLYGKRFIPCKINDQNKKDEYIELLKSYVGNVIIRGIGIRDFSGRYIKIKIYSVEKDEEQFLV